MRTDQISTPLARTMMMMMKEKKKKMTMTMMMMMCAAAAAPVVALAAEKAAPPQRQREFCLVDRASSIDRYRLGRSLSRGKMFLFLMKCRQLPVRTCFLKVS